MVKIVATLRNGSESGTFIGLAAMSDIIFWRGFDFCDLRAVDYTSLLLSKDA